MTVGKNEFYERLAESQVRWRPKTRQEQICQIVGVAAGYTTARVCRNIGSDAAELIHKIYVGEE